MTGRSSTPRRLDSIISVSGILDHPHSRVMTAGIRISNSQTRLRDLAAWCARALPEISLTLRSEGAGNTGCALHPRSRVQQCTKNAHEHTGSAEAVRHSLRNGFNGLYRALVSAISGRMCERAVLTNRPSLDLSPFVLEGHKSLSGSVGQVRCLPQPEQLHGLRARTEQGRELDDGTK